MFSISTIFFLLPISLVWSFHLPSVSKVSKFPGVYQLIEPIAHSETPSWDSRNNILWFVNYYVGQIYRYEFETGILKHINLGGPTAPVIPSRRNQNLLIAGLNLSVVAVEWDGKSAPSKTRILNHLSPQFPTSQVNDGKADKEGRLWIGTKGSENRYTGDSTPNQGVLYQISCKDLDNPRVEIAPVNISNGMAFNRANNKVFYIDTPTKEVVSYDYDGASGTITNKKVVIDITHYPNLAGKPDGMTIDKDDNLWVALYGGGSVIKVDSKSGALLNIVPLPARDVTDTMFGAPNLDILFVTTSRHSLTEEQIKEQPAAGAVFAVVGLGTKGLPTFSVDLLGSIDDQSCGASTQSYNIF